MISITLTLQYQQNIKYTDLIDMSAEQFYIENYRSKFNPCFKDNRKIKQFSFDEMIEFAERYNKTQNNKPVLYAGAVCPKCKKGINNEEPIAGYDEIRKRQQKRYGMARLCNKCIMSYVK